MEFTCLSKGSGSYFPSCHILDIGGFRVLLDCPLDLSPLAVFSPISVNSKRIDGNEKNFSSGNDLTLHLNDDCRHLDASCFICAEPLYRAVKNLQLFNVSTIDIVLISSPMGMLGLPFLTQINDFSAKVYATEAAARLGQLMMDDLVRMHNEYKQFYGPGAIQPQWITWDKLELLPKELRQIVFGEDGTRFGGWMPLYSADDVKTCMLNVQSLKLAEEACHDGTLNLKAFNSGLEIGSCNWTISVPNGSISWISNALFSPSAGMNFDHTATPTADVVLYSDTSCLNCPDANVLNSSASPQNVDEYLEVMEKIDFVCACSINSVRSGGSVLIPLGCAGIILLLLERLSRHIVSEDVKVPMFFISSVAEEFISFANVIPEWLHHELQDQLFFGHPLFTHPEMLKDGRLRVFSAAHSVKFLKTWQEPCIVFCPHWSLRLGPVVPLLRRWSGDKNSLIVLEARKNISSPEDNAPRQVLFPEALRHKIEASKLSPSLSYYSENSKICIPYKKDDDPVINIDAELAQQLQFVKVSEYDAEVSRLKGALTMERGRYTLS